MELVLNRKQWITVMLVTAMLLAAVFTLSNWQRPGTAHAAEEAGPARTITVTGVGEVTVEPDVAYLNLGVMTRAKTAEAAQSANAAIYDSLNKVLFQQFKLNERDVKTVGFYVNPEYSYLDQKAPTITGYVATHAIQISYRDLDRIGELLDAASKAGVNQVNQVQFANEHANEHELEAIKKAMANARAKAEVLAAAEKQTVKQVVQISQNSHIGGPVYSNNGGFGLAARAEADMSRTSINTGEVVITTQVQVTYSF